MYFIVNQFILIFLIEFFFIFLKIILFLKSIFKCILCINFTSGTRHLMSFRAVCLPLVAKGGSAA